MGNVANEDLGDDEIDDAEEEEEEEEEVDGYCHRLDDESTDSMTSATNLDAILPLKKEAKNPYLVKRLSGTSGSVFYQERTSLASSNPPTITHIQSPLTTTPTTTIIGDTRSIMQRLVVWVVSHPPSTILLASLTGLLILLFCSSLYLVLRLDNLQHRVDSSQPVTPSMEQLASWQSLLHTQSSRKVQEYLNTNLEQISKVRESLEKLARFLHSQQEPDNRGEGTREET